MAATAIRRLGKSSKRALTIVAADEAMAMEAGFMRRITDRARLSLGDRFCLALSRRLSSPALTTDRGWASVAGDLGVVVELIR